MPPLVKLLAILGLTGTIGLAIAQERATPGPAGRENDIRLAIPLPDLSPKGPSVAAHPKGTSFAAKQVPWRDGAPSLLAPAGKPDYLFSITPPAPPDNWDLLLGALLTGGFIARRRLRGN